MAANKVVALSSRKPRTYKGGKRDIDWNKVVLRAQEIVESYSTGVTLRQLFYKLVSAGLIPNDQNCYKNLSRKTAQARREGWFPALIDRTREIERYSYWASPKERMDEVADGYRRDRTEGQEQSVYIGVEKHGMTVQLTEWFGDLGIPVLALGGYSSQTFVNEVREHIELQGRPSVLLYAGDFDPSGVDIDRDFEERTEIFDEVRRVALTKSHLKRYNLPPMPGKAKDARAADFIAKHGELIQVELDALDPEDLRKLYQKQIDRYWDAKAYKAALEREAGERATMSDLRDLLAMSPSERAIKQIEELEDDDELLDIMDATKDRLLEI